MVVLPEASFMMGNSGAVADSLSSETPQHVVTMNSAVASGTTEVTLGEFRVFAEATSLESSGCTVLTDGEWNFDPAADWAHPGYPQADTHPVTCVSWNEAAAYSAWLSSRTGVEYRLPSESEWEFFSRAQTRTSHWYAETGIDACTAANIADRSALREYRGWTTMDCDDGYVYTAPAGQFQANGFGIRDSLGNVFEWVEDCWNPDYAGAPVDGSAWLEGDCSQRVLRGGSWHTQPAFVTASFRNHFAVEHKSSTIGFRVMRNPGEG
jgi:formylglycine-generating enzyme required for sulfatase activity